MSRFCGECGAEHKPTQKFCQSCGKELKARGEGPVVTSEPPKPKGNIRTDNDLVCPKCGANRCYTGKNLKADDLAGYEDFCADCDIPMVESDEGVRKSNRLTLFSLAGGLAIGAIALFWIFGGNDDEPEPEPAAQSSESKSEVVEEPENESAISDSDCFNLTADLSVVNDMIDIGDEYGIALAMRSVHQNANLYAKRYSGEVNHDLQILADRGLEFAEWVEGDRSAEMPDFAGAFETVMVHCGVD